MSSRKYADLTRGLQELDHLLTTMLANAFTHTTLLAQHIRSVTLAQLKRSARRENLLRTLAALNDLGVRRTRQQARQTAEEVVECTPKGVLEDCLAEFLRQGRDYLELVRQWEYHSLRAIDETFWKKLTPEKVYLTEEEAMALSERLMEIERRYGSNRKFLAATLRNVRQLYTLYTARRNFLLQKALRFALYHLRNTSYLEASRRLETAGIALLYAYRCWCRSQASSFLPMVRVKVLEVLRRLTEKGDVELADEAFLVKCERQQTDVSLSPPPAVEELPDEASLIPLEDQLEKRRQSLWRHERLLDYCSRLSVDGKRLLAFGFGYVDPLYLEALVDADRDWLPELLRQYIAKFHHHKQGGS